MRYPKWTVCYNIRGSVGDPPWVGTGWEFFDDERDAQGRQDELSGTGVASCRRPFHPSDEVHLGACHRLESAGGPPVVVAGHIGTVNM